MSADMGDRYSRDKTPDLSDSSFPAGQEVDHEGAVTTDRLTLKYKIEPLGRMDLGGESLLTLKAGDELINVAGLLPQKKDSAGQLVITAHTPGKVREVAKIDLGPDEVIEDMSKSPESDRIVIFLRSEKFPDGRAIVLGKVDTSDGQDQF
ncbi:MAG: hypothetical protein D6719_00555, partial [Candidatus Dadabacteria bacterium]